MDKPSYALIEQAVAGDKEALAQIIRIYEPMIDKESRGNPVIRKTIIEGLTEAILHYNLHQPEKNSEYLKSKYSG